MELSSRQRKAAFAVIVLALAGLGAFLLMPAHHPARAAGSASRAGSHPSARAASTGSAAPAPASVPAGSPQPGRVAGSVDIYRLLPFGHSGLDQAVALTRRFGTAYGTYSYRQNASAYVASLRGMVTSGLATTLARGYSTPGVAQARIGQKQVSAGTAQVTALRAFGPSSLTFLVTVVQKITQAQGANQLTSRYAVTVTRAGGGWQVSDIQLASAGNA